MNSLENKYKSLKKNFYNRNNFSIIDTQDILKVKKTTLSWILWKLIDKGYIYRVGRGLYSFNKKEYKIKPILSNDGNKILKILRKTEYNFFLSGLDILSIFMNHVTEVFPIILFTYPDNMIEIMEILSENDFIVSNENKYIFNDKRFTNNNVILIRQTTNFSYSNNNIAIIEKAFIDLYYEVTRNQYPLSIQELVRIFNNIQRRTYLNSNKLIQIASRRNIHYDIRYIIDKNKITNQAIQFAKRLNEIFIKNNGG